MKRQDRGTSSGFSSSLDEATNASWAYGSVSRMFACLSPCLQSLAQRKPGTVLNLSQYLKGGGGRSDHRSLSPPQILPNALRSSLAWSSWVKCYKAGIQLAGNQVLGLKALQRTDFMTFCLCVPECVRAATDHAMDHSGDSHRLEGLGVSSGS